MGCRAGGKIPSAPPGVGVFGGLRPLGLRKGGCGIRMRKVSAVPDLNPNPKPPNPTLQLKTLNPGCVVWFRLEGVVFQHDGRACRKSHLNVWKPVETADACGGFDGEQCSVHPLSDL